MSVCLLIDGVIGVVMGSILLILGLIRRNVVIELPSMFGGNEAKTGRQHGATATPAKEVQVQTKEEPEQGDQLLSVKELQTLAKEEPEQEVTPSLVNQVQTQAKEEPEQGDQLLSVKELQTPAREETAQEVTPSLVNEIQTRAKGEPRMLTPKQAAFDILAGIFGIGFGITVTLLATLEHQYPPR